MRTYTEADIDYWKIKCANKEVLHYTETDPLIYQALEKHSIKNMDVLIIGSQEPCYEALALYYGAKSVTVVEYQELKSECTKLRTLSVSEFESENKQYDCAISISSVEHSGLGRYGDPIDVDGDLKSMNVLYSSIKENGICFLAIPIGADRVEGNLHRVYGETRLPLLLKGWETIDTYGFDQEIYKSIIKRNQPLFILERRLDD